MFFSVIIFIDLHHLQLYIAYIYLDTRLENLE